MTLRLMEVWGAHPRGRRRMIVCRGDSGIERNDLWSSRRVERELFPAAAALIGGTVRIED